MDGQKLGFVNELGNDVNYRRDQTKLLKAAKKVTNNNFLDTGPQFYGECNLENKEILKILKRYFV